MTGLDAEHAAAIVDRIYEAAFVPDGWPKALEAISDVSGSAAGTFLVFGDNLPVRGRCQPVVQPLLDEFVVGDTWKLSDSVQHVYGLRPASFVVVDDLLTAEEIERDPERIKLRAIGIGTNISTTVPMPTGELSLFVFQRWLKDGTCDPTTIDLLNGFRPHLARAGLIAARLRLEQAQATVSALQSIGLPAAVLAASGRVLATNDLLQDVADVLLPAAFGQMMVADSPADLLFQEAIGQNRQHGVVRSIPVKRGENKAAVVLHVVPLRRAALDIFSGGDVLVAATVPTPTAMVPTANALTSLFDLTPAEARLAMELAAGQPLAQAAAHIGVSAGTAHNYLARIFRKTGTNQQAQLVALLKTVQPFPR
jgi:DNA-binding CsgD family transcriptional regulator